MIGDTVTVVYVAGFPRSGTTIIEAVLHQFDGFVGVGEMERHVFERGVLQNLRCGTGEPFHDAPFWREVFDRAYGGMDVSLARRMVELRSRVDRWRSLPRLWAQRLYGATWLELAEYRSALTPLYLAVARTAGARFVVDTSKNPSGAIVLDGVTNIDLRLLHLVRDARAIANSWLRRRRRPEVEDGAEDAWMVTRSPLLTTAQWSVANLATELCGNLGRPYVLLRYEDFAEEPMAKLRDVLVRLALCAPVPTVSAGGTFVHAPSPSVSGNPVRFSEWPIRVQKDEGWRTELSPAARRGVTALALPLLHRYGYAG